MTITVHLFNRKPKVFRRVDTFTEDTGTLCIWRRVGDETPVAQFALGVWMFVTCKAKKASGGGKKGCK